MEKNNHTVEEEEQLSIAEIRERILKGFELVYEQVVEEAARDNRNLVMSDGEKPVLRSGKELLRELNEKRAMARR